MIKVASLTFTHQTHPRARSLKIKIEPNGEVVVVSPRFTPQFLVKRFVKQNLTWIETKKNQLLRKKQLETTEAVSIFGDFYQKKFVNEPKSSLGFWIEHDNLMFNDLVDKNLSPQARTYKNRLSSFLKTTASHYLLPRTSQLAKQMSIGFNKIFLRSQKTRWGSCSAKGNLSFNWRLVHFPTKVIDYVIIHELAHRKHLNHSRHFWQLVAQFDPDYKNHRNLLKKYQAPVC